MNDKKVETNQMSDPKFSPERITERQVRVETQVVNLSDQVSRIGSKLADVDETLQGIGNVLAQLSARPEAKGFSEQIKTVSTTASVIAVLCGAVLWAISVSTGPIEAKQASIQAELISETKANVAARIHLEYALKRLETIDKIPTPSF